MKEEVSYPAPVVRYSGSALHVSCDEAYPHTVSLVDIDKHQGTVTVKQLRIDELRHFHVLPHEGAYHSAEEAIAGVAQFAKDHATGYFRLRVDYAVALPSNFNQMVYDELLAYGDEIRYNPKIIWEGQAEERTDAMGKPTFEVAELQEMQNPMDFIEKTEDQYEHLDLDMVRKAFEEVEAEIVRMNEEEQATKKAKAERKDKNTSIA